MTEERQASDRRIGHWLFLAVVAIIVFVYTLFKPAARNEHASAIGNSLERLQLTPLTGDGQPVGLQNLKGRVTVVNFWGTWCPPCRREFPHVVALEKRFQDRGTFQLFAVSCGTGRDTELTDLAEETAAFLHQQEFDLPTYADPEAVTRLAVAQVLGDAGFGYPTTLVLDKQGVIRGVWVGYEPGDEGEVQELVEGLLAGG